MNGTEENILHLIMAHGQKLFFTETENTSFLQMLVAVSCKNRHKRAKVVGYTELVGRYLDDDFKSHFRMTRATMEKLITLLYSQFAHKQPAAGRPYVPPQLQCLVTVWVLANQESYRSIADRFNISKSTVYTSLSRVCRILNKETNNFVKWPAGPYALSVIEGFKKIKSFPGVLGAVDGCHVDIHSMKESSSAYVNRKGRTSMILQGVCDHNCKFIDCFVGFPGSVHDARVFIRSPLFEYCTQDNLFPEASHLLGDSAYPLSKHLLVPFRDNGHLNGNQKKYNTAHAATRSVIERAFGLLKGRWRRLKYLELHDTDLLPQVIVAACVLHNLCIDEKDDIPNADVIIEEDITTEGCNEVDIIIPRNGEQKRHSILYSLL